MKNWQSSAVGALDFCQPELGYRFSKDAVDLARFVQPREKQKIADFCSGVGVVALTLLGLHPRLDFKVLGFELQEELLCYAQENIQKFEWFNSYEVFSYNLAHKIPVKYCNYFDQVMINPPYYKKNSGKLSANESKNIANFELCLTLEQWARNAHLALKIGGSLNVIFLTQRCSKELLDILSKLGFVLEARLDLDSQRSLLRLVKNGSKVS